MAKSATEQAKAYCERKRANQIGGWYILRDWNSVDFDANFILKQLQVKYGVSPFFKVSVENDPYMPDRSSIRISPSGLGLPDREYYFKDQDDRIQIAYKELIRDVVIYLSSTRNEAEKFGKDMFFYEKRIAEVTLKTETLQNPITTCNHITISELKLTMPTIPFYDILTAMYPEASINETTEVIVTSLEYLTQISQIIATTDRQTMNGYLIWTLVRNYLPYLSEKFTSVVNTFKAELFGIREILPRWEECSLLVHEFMGLASDIMNEKLDPINTKTNQVVNETFYSVLNVVRKRMGKFKYMPQLYKQLKRKLSNINLMIGLPSKVKDDHYLKEYYIKLKIMKSNLFESVKNGIAFKKKLEERLLIKNTPEDAILSSLIKIKPQVTYSPSFNTIIVSNNILNEPFFNNKYPNSVIYGRLGVEIANAMLSSILPYNSLWTSDRKLLSSFHTIVKESLNSINLTNYCLSNYILNLNVTVSYNITNETALNALKHLLAVSVANEALIQSLSTSEHVHQPSLEDYEDSALFFLTYAQMQCSESSNQQQLFDSIVNFKLPQRSMLHITWTQLPEFAESLQCAFNKKLQCPDLF